MKTAEVISSEDFAAALLSKASKTKVDHGAVGTWPKKWATETLRIAKQELSTLTGSDQSEPGLKSVCQRTGARGSGPAWSVDFPDNYAADGAVTTSKQLAKAGARLARLLKAIFP